MTFYLEAALLDSYADSVEHLETILIRHGMTKEEYGGLEDAVKKIRDVANHLEDISQ